jgi:hypothetical protein
MDAEAASEFHPHAGGRTDMEPKDLITLIAQALVDHPKQLSVNEIESTNTIIIELKVFKGDIRKVIGKQGRTIDGIRTLLGAMAGKTRKRLMLEIVE